MSEFSYMERWEIELEAMSLQCEVVVAEPHELQFDIDDSHASERFWAWHRRASFRYEYDLPVTEWRSRSGNIHRVVCVPPVGTIEERVALQAMGGSDPGREWAALQCHHAGSPHPILLYRPLPKRLGDGRRPAPEIGTYRGLFGEERKILAIDQWGFVTFECWVDGKREFWRPTRDVTVEAFQRWLNNEEYVLTDTTAPARKAVS